MKPPNDTVPDPVQRNVANDTDPSSVPVHRHETPPQVDSLLGGIGARAPKAPQMAAESAGREAAQYQAVAHPMRANVVTIEDVPAVIVRNNTQPLPRLAPPVAEPAKVAPRTAAPVRQIDTTVPGARQLRGRRDRATLVLVAGLVIVPLVVVLLWRSWRGPSIEPAGSQAIATTGPTPAITATPTMINTAVAPTASTSEAATTTTAPAPAPSATPSARPTAAKSALPPRATDAPRPTPSSAPSHDPRPTPAPTPPTASTDHVRSI